MSSTFARDEIVSIRDELRFIDRDDRVSVVLINSNLIISISLFLTVNSRTIWRVREDFARRKKDSNCLRCAKSAIACWRRNDVTCNYCTSQKNKCVFVNNSYYVRISSLTWADSSSISSSRASADENQTSSTSWDSVSKNSESWNCLFWVNDWDVRAIDDRSSVAVGLGFGQKWKPESKSLCSTELNKNLTSTLVIESSRVEFVKTVLR
jgi:hypothetical protein